jgi:hypothetical protein
MMASVDFKVELKGLADLQRKLEGKIRRLEQRTIREAQQAFADPIAQRYEQMIHQKFPKLKVVTNIKIRGSVGWIRIGASAEPYIAKVANKIRRLTHGQIAYWFERGFNILAPPYRSKKGGAIWRSVGADPILERTWESQKQIGLDAFEKVMRDALEETVPD